MRIAFLFITGFLLSCALAPQPYRQSEDTSELVMSGSRPTTRYPGPQKEQIGIASFTADEIQGKKTASGRIYNMRELVAAHPTLPFGTIVRVTNLENNKSVEVEIIDRGPYVRERIIDVSFEAAKRLGFIRQGTAKVRVEIIRVPRTW